MPPGDKLSLYRCNAIQLSSPEQCIYNFIYECKYTWVECVSESFVAFMSRRASKDSRQEDRTYGIAIESDLDSSLDQDYDTMRAYVVLRRAKRYFWWRNGAKLYEKRRRLATFVGADAARMKVLICNAIADTLDGRQPRPM